MDKENVSYINIKPYHYSIPYKDMATKYYRMVINKNNISENDFVNFIVNYMNKYNYIVKNKSVVEEKTDAIVSKKLLSHLEDFLKSDRLPNTRKRRVKRTKTMKRLV